MNFFAKFKKIFLDHSALFRVLKEERGIGKSLVFYCLFAFILLLINWLVLYFGEIPANLFILKGISLTDIIIFQVPVFFFVLNMIIIFFFAGFAVIFSKLMKKETSFSDNIKTFAHAYVPFILTSWIIAFNVIFGLWSVYLNSKGISEMNNIGLKQSFYIVVSAGIFTGLVSFIGIYLIMLNFGIDFDLARIFLTRT